MSAPRKRTRAKRQREQHRQLAEMIRRWRKAQAEQFTLMARIDASTRRIDAAEGCAQ